MWVWKRKNSDRPSSLGLMSVLSVNLLNFYLFIAHSFGCQSRVDQISCPLLNILAVGWYNLLLPSWTVRYSPQANFTYKVLGVGLCFDYAINCEYTHILLQKTTTTKWLVGRFN